MFWPFKSRKHAEPDNETSPEHLEDSALIERSRKRDAVAFGVLYERYLDKVYRYIAYRTSNATIAEDLTSEVFLNAWKAIERYEDRGYAFSTWLLRLAHNEVADHYRTQRRNTPFPETDTFASEEGDPSSFAELQVEQVTLLHAVRQLPDEWQQIILLRFVEGVSFDEIAMIVGKSSGACRVTQHRALARLRQILTVEEGSHGP